MPQDYRTVLQAFENYDPNPDGDPTLERLGQITLGIVDDPEGDAPLVVLLIESRLGDETAAIEGLNERLARYADDLRREGKAVLAITISPYSGPRHQDGRTLLAIRDLLAAIRNQNPALEGVVLIGAFPDACLVRRCAWVPGFSSWVDGQEFRGGRYLKIASEIIAGRADILLADLGGNWRALYREGSDEHANFCVGFEEGQFVDSLPPDGEAHTFPRFAEEVEEFVDYFELVDCDVETRRVDGGLEVVFHHHLLHPEVAGEAPAVAPLATPDIYVSRINALYVAVNPSDDICGDDGTLPLDDRGLPQTFTSERHLPTNSEMFCWDPHLERKLLVEYFDRNHRYRTGSHFGARPRVTVLDAGNPKALEEQVQPLLDTVASTELDSRGHCSLLDYVEKLPERGALTYVSAHSSPEVSMFGSDYDVSDLTSATGGRPFRWVRDGNDYRPSFEGQGGTANFYLHRTIWQSRRLVDRSPTMIVHMGCSVGAPSDTDEPYLDEDYADFQNAESQLFYLNAVAVVARAKGFNDRPRDLPDRLAEGCCLGEALAAYHRIEANDPKNAEVRQAIRAKKAYFWNIHGDWTLRLPRRPILGRLSWGPELTGGMALPERALADHRPLPRGHRPEVHPGDFCGQGHSEVLLRTEDGLDLFAVTHEPLDLYAAPEDSWIRRAHHPSGQRLGGWLLGSEDRILAILRGSGKRHYVLIQSAWGLGVLGWRENGLRSLALAPWPDLSGDGSTLSADSTVFVGGGRFDSSAEVEWILETPTEWRLFSLKEGRIESRSVATRSVVENRRGVDSRSACVVEIAAGVSAFCFCGAGQLRLGLASSGGRWRWTTHSEFQTAEGARAFEGTPRVLGSGLFCPDPSKRPWQRIPRRHEFLVEDRSRILVLRWDGETLHQRAEHSKGGAPTAFWPSENLRPLVFRPLDFDGDGQDEIAVVNADQLSFWE